MDDGYKERMTDARRMQGVDDGCDEGTDVGCMEQTSGARNRQRVCKMDDECVQWTMGMNLVMRSMIIIL